MAERFYTPDPLNPGEYVLTRAEAHHLAAVRRLGPGDRVTLFNGDGNEYPAEVLAAAKKSVTLTILATQPADRELPFPLIVASALPKGDRADFLVEKLTELGVTRFVPLVAARSVVVPKEAAAEKFNRFVIEASKQCGRNRLMTVESPQKWKTFVARDDLPHARLVLHTGTELPHMPQCDGAAVAVGPEGGFTVEELELATAAGWAAISLGPRVLRVETAAVVAATILGAATA